MMGTFGVSPGRTGRFDLINVLPMLEDLHTRLSSVVIECLDFEAFIRRYDRPDTFFYLDPPYWGSEGDYGKALFSRADFERLAGVLRSLKGQFLMSINDVSGVREVFSGFGFDEVETTYTISQKGPSGGRAAELIIRG